MKITICFLLIINNILVYAQQKDSSTCRVLLQEISNMYTGGCKNGLAEGKGKAVGDDETYVGMFQRGLPEGKGTYTYTNGNVYSGNWRNGLKHGKGTFKYIINGKVTVLEGFWKNGDYAGTSEPEEEYRITALSGIEYYSVKRTDNTENVVEISFERVMTKYIPRDLTVSISSGYKNLQTLKLLILGYSFPLYCTVHFTIPNSNGLPRECTLGLIIFKPGKYEVFISNNT